MLRDQVGVFLSRYGGEKKHRKVPLTAASVVWCQLTGLFSLDAMLLGHKNLPGPPVAPRNSQGEEAPQAKIDVTKTILSGALFTVGYCGEVYFKFIDTQAETQVRQRKLRK